MSTGGEEYHLEHGDYAAVVCAVGAGLRALWYAGRDLVRPYEARAVRPKSSGALLVPWPNRVVDGVYTFDGSTYQLDLSEPTRHHAIHGLVRWERFLPVSRDDASVLLRHDLVPRPGYPFPLQVEARYALTDDGLTVTVSVTNQGERALPYGLGSHPYLVGGPGTVDDWTVHLPAGEVLEVTPDRLVPVALRPVSETDLDFSSPRRVSGALVDHAYTALRPDGDGLVRARVTGPAGTGTECEWDPAVLPWAQLHTADVPGSPDLDRTGMAVEPMSCPPDAFSSGTDLVVLGPGERHAASWTLRALQG